MSKQNHHRCRDVSRDEAIRAAEDAAANWRRLEVGEVVQEGDECRDLGQWMPAAGIGLPVVFGETYRRRRVPLPDHRDLPQAVAELRKRVAALEDHFADAGKMVTTKPAPVPPADGLRTERVTLEFQVKGSPPNQWPWSYIISRSDAIKMRPGESVRVVEDATLGSGDVFADVGCGSTGDEIDRLTAERNAAREECERLRAILPPESERGRGVGEGSWAVFAEKAVAERDEAKADLATMRGKCDGLKDRVAELEAAAAANASGEKPQPPRGWLTEEERELIAGITDDDDYTEEGQNIAKALLARNSPPRVRLPEPPFARSNVAYGDWMMCLEAVKKALAAAGVEVGDE